MFLSHIVLVKNLLVLVRIAMNQEEINLIKITDKEVKDSVNSSEMEAVILEKKDADSAINFLPNVDMESIAEEKQPVDSLIQKDFNKTTCKIREIV